MTSNRQPRPEIRLVMKPVPHLIIKDENPDDVWRVGSASSNIERISSQFYISHIDSGLAGSGTAQSYQLTIRVDGEVTLLNRVVALAQAGRLFEETDPETCKLREAARPTLRIPIAARPKLHLDLTTIDDSLIVKTVAYEVLKCGGTFHRFHGETANSGRYPGTPDFIVEALIGFASVAKADSASLLLNNLDYDELVVRKLYDVDDRRVILHHAA